MMREGRVLILARTLENGESVTSSGNIMSLTRYGASDADRSVLGFAYTGNRMTGTVDVVNQHSFSFGYDADGNRTADGRTGFEFSYNILNLPMSAEDSADGRTMTYTYLSDGTKLKAVSDGGAGLTYRGSFVYGLTSGGGCTLESVATDEGRIVMDGTAVKDEWHVRDHVGNVRSVVWLNAPAGTSVSASILEQNDYLPFGTRLPGSRTDQSNRYRLGGKEEQDIAGMDLSLLDFGARYYDAYVGRWNAIDPLAHKYFGMSPYNYCGNDPVNKLDPDGRIVVIWYEEDGEMKSYKYSGGECTCKNEYVQSVVEAYKFDKENWHKAGFEGKSPIEQLVERTDASCNIIHYPGRDIQFYPSNGGIANINWSANEGTEYDGGIVVSPATDLAHEADHANDYLDDSYKHSIRTEHKNPTFDNDEEERVITGSEQKTAYANGEIKKGQVTRRNHRGTPVKVVGGPTSHIKAK